MPREAVLCVPRTSLRTVAGAAHLAPGTKENTASCTAFFEDIKRRGLIDPLLIVTDGAPGLIRAVDTCFPRALRQRCLVHRLRNLYVRLRTVSGPEIAIQARRTLDRRRVRCHSWLPIDDLGVHCYPPRDRAARSAPPRARSHVRPTQLAHAAPQ